MRMEHDIFICYETTTGVSFAENLKTALEKRKGYNHEVFLANETLVAGDIERDEIDSALNSCKYFIAVITSLAMDSDWVIREYRKAVKMNKRIIPCRYSKISVSDTKELANIWQIDFLDKSDLANKVILELKKIERREKKGIGIKKDEEEFLKRENLLYSLERYEDAEKEYQKALKINLHLGKTFLILKYEIERNHRIAIKWDENLRNAANNKSTKDVTLPPYYHAGWSAFKISDGINCLKEKQIHNLFQIYETFSKIKSDFEQIKTLEVEGRKSQESIQVELQELREMNQKNVDELREMKNFLRDINL